MGVHVRLAVGDVRGPFPIEGQLGNPWDLQVLAVGMLWHAQVLRLRRVRGRLVRSDTRDVAFPLSGQGRHAKVVISEFNSWPA